MAPILILSSILLTFLAGCGPSSSVPSGASVERAQSSIRGGQMVDSEDPIARSTVSLVEYGRARCTASILGDAIAITAAHCVDHRQKGNTAFREGFSLGFTANESRPVVAWRFHPGWVEGLGRRRIGTVDDQNGDVVLLRFSGGLPAGFAPAALLPAQIPLRNGDEVILAGFGSQDDARLDREEGRALRRAAVPVLRAREGFYEVHLDQRGGRGACKGDSGGPAFLLQNGVPLLWGVTSRMAEWEDGADVLCQRTSVYADIRRLEPWYSQGLAELRAL